MDVDLRLTFVSSSRGYCIFNGTLGRMPQLCSGLVLLVAVPGRVAIAGAMLVVVMMPAMAWCQLSGQAPAPAWLPLAGEAAGGCQGQRPGWQLAARQPLYKPGTAPTPVNSRLGTLTTMQW